ncbi:MAG: NAD(P)H-quinone oxidoreductase [Oscillospiraceae bacterium]|nr:NAD(P)H-quinone oxidoreductase [Oscillospiraceae bacterium]
MKAILVNDDKSLRWDNVPDPIIGEEDVLVKVEYAALNRADLMQREGDYPPPPGCPEWMGLEVSGEIVKMGAKASEKSDLKLGDKVCALLGGGGYAEYVSVKYDMLMPIPKNCSMAEAAAIPEAFATAYLKLFVEGKAKKGDTLLMQAGASGLASVVIPMAKAFGLRVVTSVITDPENIKHLGADLVVNTKEQSLPEVLKNEELAGRAIDIAIDCLGGQNLGDCLPYVKYGCRWIVIAALAGETTQIELKNIYKKNIRIVGSTLRSRTPEMKAEILASLVKEIWPKVEAGFIKPTIHAVLPITEAEDAHDILYKGQNVGKVVLKVQ